MSHIEANASEALNFIFTVFCLGLAFIIASIGIFALVTVFSARRP